MSEIFGPERKACVAREISKKLRTTNGERWLNCNIHFTENGVKGEIVMLVAGKDYEEKTTEEKEGELC